MKGLQDFKDFTYEDFKELIVFSVKNSLQRGWFPVALCIEEFQKLAALAKNEDDFVNSSIQKFIEIHKRYPEIV